MIQGCKKEPGCDHEQRPGPAVVSIDCTDEAREDALPDSPLLVEYTNESGDWRPCLFMRGNGVSDDLYTQPVCNVDSPTPPRFSCGHSGRLQFEIRASQNGRTAGPIEIQTRMKNHCDYDEKTLYHELTLDLP